MTKVLAVTVTYGNRWKFLSQVVSTLMKDSYVAKLVIVDNGSKNKKDIEEGVRGYADRVVILRQEKNLGSAGGFAVGLEYARNTEYDFVFLLDDDNLPEEDATAEFLAIQKLFGEKKVVLCGNRIAGTHNQEYFYKPITKDISPRWTFFEVFSFTKIIHFFWMMVASRKKSSIRGPFIPVVPNESFIYGGAFIPIEAVREAPLPDASLILYGDDIEYSWGIKNLGYESYLCSSPRITDLESSFGESDIFGLFDPKTHAFKVYYRIRNMIRISIRNTRQTQFILFINIAVWVFGLSLLGLVKYGFASTYFKRLKLIMYAVYAGYGEDVTTPQDAELP